jgi:hypothetical protein
VGAGHSVEQGVGGDGGGTSEHVGDVVHVR